MSLLDHLGLVWAAWARVGSSLTDEQWAAPTRLPGWAVVDVYAHHSAFPGAIATIATSPAADAPMTHAGASALLAMFNAPNGPAHTMSDVVRDRAVALARERSTSDLVAEFEVTAARATEVASSVRLDQPIDYGGVAVLAFGEALRIALLEAVVHYLDLARALDLPVPGPVVGEPLRATAALLAEVADPVVFVERATGRSDVEVLPVIR
ncbi:MAG TPA: maleylpyruvate isomerase N-terminal domain-containing protein [Micromonosporaceae bacterium]